MTPSSIKEPHHPAQEETPSQPATGRPVLGSLGIQTSAPTSRPSAPAPSLQLLRSQTLAGRTRTTPTTTSSPFSLESPSPIPGLDASLLFQDNRAYTIKAIKNEELRGLTKFFHLQGVSFSSTVAPTAGLSPLCVAALATPLPPSSPSHRYPTFADDSDDLPDLTDQDGGGSLGEEDLSDLERTGHHLLDLRLISDQEGGVPFQASPACVPPLPQPGEESEDDLPDLVLHSSDEEDYPRTAHDASASFAFHQTDGQDNTPPLTLRTAQQLPPIPPPSTERVPLGTLSPVTPATATSTVRSPSSTYSLSASRQEGGSS